MTTPTLVLPGPPHEPTFAQYSPDHPGWDRLLAALESRGEPVDVPLGLPQDFADMDWME